jgi:hypothetical protein
MKKSLIELGVGLICLGFGIKYTNKGMIDIFKAKAASKQQENKVEE